MSEWGGGVIKWRHNGYDGVSNYQPHRCLLNRLFRRRSKKASKFCATGLCAGNSPVTREFPAQMASNAENVSIWWRHHDKQLPEIKIKKLRRKIPLYLKVNQPFSSVEQKFAYVSVAAPLHYMQRGEILYLAITRIECTLPPIEKGNDR